MELKLEQIGIRIQFKWNGIKDDLESEYGMDTWNCRYRPESIVAGYSVTRHYLGLMQHLNK